MDQIKTEFQFMYGKSMYKEISKDVSGDFEKILLSLVGRD